MTSHKVGKTKIRIEAEGCTKCGTRYSTGWSIARVVKVQIGNRTFELPISVCDDCKKNGDGDWKWQQLDL